MATTSELVLEETKRFRAALPALLADATLRGEVDRFQGWGGQERSRRRSCRVCGGSSDLRAGWCVRHWSCRAAFPDADYRGRNFRPVSHLKHRCQAATPEALIGGGPLIQVMLTPPLPEPALAQLQAHPVKSDTSVPT